MSIPYLLEGIQSPQKEEREYAENSLLERCATDPPDVFIELIDIATNNNVSASTRQLALLCLRKFITMYWSAGFPSYVGPPGVGEQGKDLVRRGLLSLLANEGTEKKVISTVTYCIVQICAVDFPDEWPGLLDYLNEVILNSHSENAISLLTELVQDIITNEMFFDNHSGAKIVNTVLLALNDNTFRLQAKSKLLQLYHHCISQLRNASMFVGTELMNEWLIPHLKSMNDCIDKLLESYENNMEPEVIELKGELFMVLSKSFDLNQGILGSNGDLSYRLRITLDVIKSNANSYASALTNNDELRLEMINSSCINTIQYLGYIPSELIENVTLPDFTEDFIKLCLLPENYFNLSDFNEFISKETGLSASYTARDEIGQYLSSCSDEIYHHITDSVLQKCLQVTSNEAQYQEACLFLFQELCSNETSMNVSRYQDFLSLAVIILDDEACPIFVKSRIILTIPKFFENNVETLPQIKQLVQQFLAKTVNCTISAEDDFLLASLVISFTYYTSFAELGSVLDYQTSMILQQSLLKAIKTLYVDSEEDSLGLLLEAMHEIVKTWHFQQDLHTKKEILNLLLKLSSSEPSNVRIVFESVRSVPYLLRDINSTDYTRLCESCFPSFIEAMSTFLQSHQTYSPLVVLALEFLSVFLKNPPMGNHISDEVAEFVLHPIVQFIKECPDEKIVETALQAFVYLACNSNPKFWKDSMFDLCSLVFDSERSLYKIIDVTPIMLLSLRITQPHQNRFIGQIMEYTISKLVDPNKLHPVDSFIILSCEIILKDMQSFLAYIFSIPINAEESIPDMLIRELFDCFEESRSKNMLKEVALSISELFFSNDQRLTGSSYHDESDGVTRPFKEYVVKIFADELARETYIEEEEGEEETDITPKDYEGDYVSQLNDDVVLLTGRVIDMELKEILVQFFKSTQQSNDSSLGRVLKNMDEQERLKILSALSK